MSGIEASKRIHHRTRIKKACEPCRRRRRKCDGLMPCSQCATYEYDCEYPDGRKGRIGVPNGDDHNRHQQRESGSVPALQTTNHARLDSSVIRTDACAPSLSPEERQKDKPDQYVAKPRPYVDLEKGRYNNAWSGIALPGRLDSAMGLQANLRLHAYAWTVGTRLEPLSAAQPAVCQFLTFQEMSFYSRIFFDVVDPVFHFVDSKRYFDRCSAYWSTEVPRLEDFEALVCGVVCLGSFFAKTPSPVEAQLLEHAKTVLDRGSTYAPGRLSLDQVAGWILRTLHLRLVTRPHLSWFSSCATMHVAEAMALHVDLENARLAIQNDETFSQELRDSRRNLFTAAVFLNTLISADYGRSRMVLQDLEDTETASDAPLMRLTRVLWKLEANLDTNTRQEVLHYVGAIDAAEPVLILLKVDVCIHLFRRHVGLCQPRMEDEEVRLMLKIIQEGFSAVRTLAMNELAWWNVLFTSFQSLLVLLAMDVDQSLELVQEAMSVMRFVAETFPTHLTQEVVEAAHRLVSGLRRRKAQHVSLLTLDETLNEDNAHSSTTTTTARQCDHDEASMLFNDWFPLDANWMGFFEDDWLAGQPQRSNVLNVP